MLTTWDEHRLLYLYTQVVLKVTLLIYFNENHNRHKERSFQLQSTLSAFSLLQMCIFATNKSQKAALENTCTSKGDTLSSLLRCITHCLTVHTFTAWSIEAFSNCWWMSIDTTSSTRRNLVTHLCFIHTVMLDVILTACFSVASCYTATTRKGTPLGRFTH